MFGAVEERGGGVCSVPPAVKERGGGVCEVWTSQVEAWPP